MTLHAEDRDPSVDPGADFYRFANGGWLDEHPIPAGFGAWGSFEEIHTRNEAIVHDLLVHAAERPSSELDRQLGDYFASGMDTHAIEAAGLDAVAPFLAAIDSVEAKHITRAPEALADWTSPFLGKLPAKTMKGTPVSAALFKWA